MPDSSSASPKGRPLVALKIAQSADGYVADAKGNSQWITGERPRAVTAICCARSHDAILVGIGTETADDPLLTVRLPGLEDRSPIRVVLDTHLRLPPDSQLAQNRAACRCCCSRREMNGRRTRLTRLGVQIERVAADGAGRPDLAALCCRRWGARGTTRLLVEGGPAHSRSAFRTQARRPDPLLPSAASDR